MPGNASFSLSSGKISKFRMRPTMAIVTIANNCLAPNGGLDEEIRACGGRAFEKAIAKRRGEDLVDRLFYDTGEAILTESGDLHAKGVIHAVVQPIMNLSALYSYEIQVRHTLRTTYHSIMAAAQNAEVQTLIVPLINPAALSTEDAIIISMHAIEEKAKKGTHIYFVTDDPAVSDMYDHCSRRFKNATPFKFTDSIWMLLANKKQEAILEQTFMNSKRDVPTIQLSGEKRYIYSISVAAIEELPPSDAVCVVVNKKLRYSGNRSTIIGKLSSCVGSPISGRTSYNNGFIFLTSTTMTHCNGAIYIVLEDISTSIRNNIPQLQCHLMDMYTDIFRCAHIHNFKSLAIPILAVSGINVDLSISLATYICMELQDQYKVADVYLYHEDRRIMQRIFYLLAYNRTRDMSSNTFRALFRRCLPRFPCSEAALKRLPTLIHLMWETLPTFVRPITHQSCVIPRVNAITQSTSTGTRITIIRADIAAVPAPNDMIHSVAPTIRQGAKPTEEDVYRLQSAYDQAIRLAEFYKFDTILLPFLGTGIFSFPAHLGMTIALHSVLQALPAQSIREVVFVHPKEEMVRSFIAMMGGKEIVINSRNDADAHIRLCCSSFVPPSWSGSAQRKVQKELDGMWKITERLFAKMKTPSRREHSRAAATGDTQSKRRVTPDPPKSHKRKTPQETSAAESSVDKEEEAAFKRLQANLRQLKHRAALSEEKLAEKRKKDAERQRKKRASQSEARMREEGGEESSDGRNLDVEKESSEQHSERLRKMRVRLIEREASENPSQKATPLGKKKEGMARLRKSESEDQYATRLQKGAEREARRREEETEDQYATRLQKGAEREARRREEETEDQYATRLRKGAERDARRREEETEEKRATRRQKDSERHATLLQNMNRDERADRREMDKERHKAAREKTQGSTTDPDKTQRPILDVLSKKRDRARLTPEQRAAIRKADAEMKFWHPHDPRRPIRKKGSQVITDAERWPNSLPDYYDLGPRPVCKYCSALTYTGTCCNGGQVHVRLPSAPPKFLQELLVGDTPKAKHFRANIMAYNRCFQMASTSSERTHTAHSNPFMKINGNIQHQMGGINQPPGASLALFNQIYPFEPKEACAERMKNWNSKHLDEEIVQELSTFLHENNFLAKQFHMISKIEKALEDEGRPVPQRLMTLRAPTREELKGNHPGTMSRPRHELNSALYRTDETGAAPAHGVWVYKEGNCMRQLKYDDPLTDALCYPLLFPYGEETFRYGQDKLFPKGTTREQAGFVYHKAEPTEIDEEEAEDKSDDEQTEDEWDDDEDPFADVSSLTRMQIDNKQSTTDGGIEQSEGVFEDELLYEPRREIDTDEISGNLDYENFGSSDDDDNSSFVENVEEADNSLPEAEDCDDIVNSSQEMPKEDSSSSRAAVNSVLRVSYQKAEKKLPLRIRYQIELEQKRRPVTAEEAELTLTSYNDTIDFTSGGNSGRSRMALRQGLGKVSPSAPTQKYKNLPIPPTTTNPSSQNRTTPTADIPFNNLSKRVIKSTVNSILDRELSLRSIEDIVAAAFEGKYDEELAQAEIDEDLLQGLGKNRTTPTADIPSKKSSTTTDKGHLSKRGIKSTINSILDRELSLRSIDDIVAAAFEGKYDEELAQAGTDEEYRRFLRRPHSSKK